ncbi:hypothetical protein XU19_23870, partial [Vibrio parahaemolyticus]
TEDHVVRLWNVGGTGRPRPLGSLTGFHAAVRSLAFSHDGRTLAAGGDDLTIRLWDMTRPARPKPVGEPLTGHTQH